MADYLRFFRPKIEPLDPDAEMFNKANELIDFANTAYYVKFISWLEEEIMKPTVVSKDLTVNTESAVRANTLKEIRSTLVRRVASARAAATRVAEE